MQDDIDVTQFEKERQEELESASREEILDMKYSEKRTHKRNPYIEEKILGWLAEGKTKKQAAENSGITEQTLYNWIKADPIFKKRVENNLGGTIILKAVDTVAQAVRDGDLQAAQWYLKNTKHFDKRYQEQQDGSIPLEKNPRTGAFEVVSPTSIAGALLGEELEDEIDLEEALYLNDPDFQ